MSADERESDRGGEALENEFRAMFAERSQTVRVTTAPYAAVRQRIVAARRKRRMRIGGAGVAFAMAVAGIGAWSTVPTRQHSAVAPTSTDHAAGEPAHVVYADGHTEIPAGPLRDAAVSWLRTNYRGELSGLTVVTTFDRLLQTAAASNPSRHDSGVAVLDSRNGTVLALGGAWDRPLPIGDLMKPIVLATAFQTGHYSPDSKEPLDTQTHPLHWPAGAKQLLSYYAAPEGGLRAWPPESPTTTIHDVYVSLTQAAESGANGPFAQLELAPGMNPTDVRDLAVRMGMPNGTKDLVPVPPLVLGVVRATPLTMAAVYATLADGGVHRDPRMVGKLLAKDGRTVWTPTGTGVRVMSQSAAEQVEGTLHAALVNGTTGAAVELRTSADKGTWAMGGAPDNDLSAWFDGADSAYVVSVGLSKVDANGALAPLGNGHGGGPAVGSRTAGPLWAGVVQVLRNRD